MNAIVRSALAAGVAALASWSSAARADDESPPPPPPPRRLAPPPPRAFRAPQVIVAVPGRDVVTTQETTPNTDLIAAGATMFGLTYGTSLFVAIASDRASDQNLYIPVAGPWMDLATRAPCEPGACAAETVNKVLLVGNGLLQGAGVLQIVGGFLLPQTRTVTRSASVHVAPTVSSTGVGVSAWGSF